MPAATAVVFPFNALTVAAFFRRPDVRQAQQKLRAAQALADKRRAHVNSYVLPLLTTFDLRVDKGTSCDALHGKKITNPDHLYLSSDEAQCARFYEACDAAHKANGYDLPAGYCPALVAENECVEAERALIGLFADAFGDAWRHVYMPEPRKELLNLLLNPPRG
jgi:hypothetical protein